MDLGCANRCGRFSVARPSWPVTLRSSKPGDEGVPVHVQSPKENFDLPPISGLSFLSAQRPFTQPTACLHVPTALTLKPTKREARKRRTNERHAVGCCKGVVPRAALSRTIPAAGATSSASNRVLRCSLEASGSSARGLRECTLQTGKRRSTCPDHESRLRESWPTL